MHLHLEICSITVGLKLFYNANKKKVSLGGECLCLFRTDNTKAFHAAKERSSREETKFLFLIGTLALAEAVGGEGLARTSPREQRMCFERDR